MKLQSEIDPIELLKIVSTPADWEGQGDAYDLARGLHQLLTRLATYHAMLLGALQLCAISVQFRNPALIEQATDILGRLVDELEERPLFVVHKEEEFN